ncbi:MAG: class II fructose-bisphosphate aldolase [Anaerolineales bacterium]|nr:class II fructose-bisphosphate aldolase [Anaerolineales bacterium]
MPLVPSIELLHSARQNNYAVGAFNADNMEVVQAVVESAQEFRSPLIVDTDEHPRYKVVDGDYVLDTSMEILARLRPAFRKGGTVTAGNSSGINNGAAALLLISENKARKLELKPMARWVGSAAAGVDPGVMGYGPAPATKKLLDRLTLSLKDIGLIELNEAFAAQSLGVMRLLEMNSEITNENGGAIALGHPIGFSGARIFSTLLHEMKRRAPEENSPYYGLATLRRCWDGSFHSS